MKALVKMMRGKIVNNKIAEKAQIKAVFSSTRHHNIRYLACKINGFWFYLSCSMWEEYTGVKRGTILSRIYGGKPIEQALGFKKIPRGPRKKTMWDKM